jgi:myo-inositol-1(or 4)-monophosphatase
MSCCDVVVTAPEIDVAELRSTAERLAMQAAQFVRLRRPQVFGAGRGDPGDAVRSKSTRTDPVTVVDTEVEQLLRRRLAQLRPGEPVLGEEGGGPRGAADDSAVTWVLDPIDGTVNFMYGVPAYAVSVAAQRGGTSLAGAVADVANDRIYSAVVDLGADVRHPDGSRERLHCNTIDDVSLALIGTGFGYSPERRAVQAALLVDIIPHVRDIRRIGSAALDLCMVAAGRLDGFYEHGLNRWDWAAGALIAAEAGAYVQLPGDDHAAGLTLVAAGGIAENLRGRLEQLGAHEVLPTR